jgi:DNA-binding winged helix-turn-helix (wHTH) protein/TolB-like protein
MGAGRLRFGVFDFDPGTGELRREGVPVRLQAQPAQVLSLLLQQAGEVVSRDTLRLAVWGTETFVDFDRGLNFCIAQIRGALGDSADSPRFVRTIPKRGYQFVAPVGRVETFVPAPLPPDPQPVAKARRIWPAAAALAAVLVCAFAMYGWTNWLAKPAVRVAVARFDNETGNPDLDRFADGLTDSIVAELTGARTGRYEVIGNAAILREPRSRRDLIRIASSLKVGYVVLGQVQNQGKTGAGGVRVLAHLIALPEQTHIQVIRSEFGAGEAAGSELETARRVASQFSRPLAAGRRRRIESAQTSAR